jgi:hydroxymethylpyrimidine pyrophosphatase-like HAD family hydrolase
MKKALVFDIDNTLTPPRRLLEREMAEILKNLVIPFFLVAGSDLPLIRDQFFDPLHAFGFRKGLEAFLCNGATRYHCDFSDKLSIETIRDFDFREYLGEDDFKFMLSVVKHTLKMKEFQLPLPMVVLGKQIIFRHSMVNIAPIGRPEGQLAAEAYRNRDAFVEYDQTTGFRRKMMAHLNDRLVTLRKERKLVISLGGQTSFDFVIEGNDKSYAIKTLLNEGLKELIFVGDALFEGGNDEAILHFINNWPKDTPCPVQAVQVKDWKDTIRYLNEMGFIKING